MTDAKTKRVQAIRRAAIRFANDYGPLAAANAGDEEAAHAVAHRLFMACAGEGLKIIVNPDSQRAWAET